MELQLRIKDIFDAYSFEETIEIIADSAKIEDWRRVEKVIMEEDFDKIAEFLKSETGKTELELDKCIQASELAFLKRG